MALKKINMLPVINAKRPIVLHITRKDITRSDKKDPSHCAAATCLKRQMKNVKDVRVHLSRVLIRQNDGNYLRFATSPRLKQEIIAFDRGGQFEPGDYTLFPPPKSRATGKRQGSPKINRNKRKIKRKYYRFTNVRTSAQGAYSQGAQVEI